MTLFWTLSILGAILELLLLLHNPSPCCRWGGESRQEERLAAAVGVYDQLEREQEWRTR